MKFLILFFVILLNVSIYSCKGQSKPNNSENQKTTLSESKKIDDFKDPLFFIEGQLCQHLRVIFEDSKGNL